MTERLPSALEFLRDVGARAGYARIVTSESVTEGHPDKICDQVSDAILDAFLAGDPAARVACETLAAGNMIGVYGEITSTATVDIEALVRNVAREIGYTDPDFGLDAATCDVRVELRPQAPEIATAVSHEDAADAFDAVGAGDQGLMFGYATDETATLMPLPIDLAHRLARRLARVRKDGTLSYLRPDGKTQVTIGYDAAGSPAGIVAIVVSAQHDSGIAIEQIRHDLHREVVDPVIPVALLRPETLFHLNPSGSFVVGGPTGDTGLTGRKIMVDTYGSTGHHGGGCFSGKDPTKVDRSGAYAARQAAKWLVAKGYARRAEVSVAYAIGVAAPLAINVETFGSSRSERTDAELSDLVATTFALRPAAIIARLGLRRPIYRQVAAYGHFGRDDDPAIRYDRACVLSKERRFPEALEELGLSVVGDPERRGMALADDDFDTLAADAEFGPQFHRLVGDGTDRSRRTRQRVN